MDLNTDEIMFASAEYMGAQQQAIPHHSDSWTYSPAYTNYTAQEPALWLALSSAYLQPSQHQCFSATSQSSFPANSHTLSDDSVFSQGSQRSSMASTNSSLSYASERPYSESNLGPFMNLQPAVQPMHIASPAEGSESPASSIPRKRSAQRQVTPERDAFATCVSRTRRSRRSQGEPRYWCTSCQEPFIEKYDWKRHEETYQERWFEFRCNLCSAIYFLEKDFVHHHKTRHNCETCQRDQHMEAAKQERQTRTGWGCGFCLHFSSDWRERCNHIAQHFEQDCKTMQDWRHSQVIESLLQRPAVKASWHKILQSQPQLKAEFGWNQHNTGRVEGYPENKANPHLQDQLEYYIPSDNAVALAQLAFEKIAFPSFPPPAPPKDYKDHHNTSLKSLMDNQVSWDVFMNTIHEDDNLPTNVCELDFSITNDLFGDRTKIYY